MAAAAIFLGFIDAVGQRLLARTSSSAVADCPSSPFHSPFVLPYYFFLYLSYRVNPGFEVKLTFFTYLLNYIINRLYTTVRLSAISLFVRAVWGGS